MTMLKKGDRVSWNASQGPIPSRIVRKQMSPTHIEAHKVAASKVAASKDNPEFIVQSDKSGKQAAHKAKALTKLD